MDEERPFIIHSLGKMESHNSIQLCIYWPSNGKTALRYIEDNALQFKNNLQISEKNESNMEHGL